jgi:hypothetical protein
MEVYTSLLKLNKNAAKSFWEKMVTVGAEIDQLTYKAQWGEIRAERREAERREAERREAERREKREGLEEVYTDKNAVKVFWGKWWLWAQNRPINASFLKERAQKARGRGRKRGKRKEKERKYIQPV